MMNDAKISRTLEESVPEWDSTKRASGKKPNVLLVLCDDLGFADVGCYGSEIMTPTIDALAETGLRFSNFHVTPLCSPSRASLLTGVNHHAAGVGDITIEDQGFPGYRGQLSDDVISAAEVFRHNGYATIAIGKWHLTPPSTQNDAAERGSWPLQRGFDRYYGFLDGLTNFHHPHSLFEDNHLAAVDEYPDGYYLTDDLTERAIEYIRSSKTVEPERPVFLYFAHGAVHAPLQAKSDDIDKYRGRYDVGWDAIREERFQRQRDLGVISQDTRMAPPNAELNATVDAWDELTLVERQLAARYMEVYAAMVDNVDQSLARMLACLEELGERDNTLVLFMSDNGASREGGTRGTTEHFRTVMAIARMLGDVKDDQLSRDEDRLELIGGPRAFAHYPQGWAMASNTPFRLYKGTTFAGGHQVPLVASWPAHSELLRGRTSSEYVYITDVLPTLIDLLELRVPPVRQSHPVRPMDGVSFAHLLRENASPSRHREQYYEVRGQRGYYRNGWGAVTYHLPGDEFSDREWQLYHLTDDPTELVDLATQEEERVAELAAAWDRAAWANKVYPLTDLASNRYRLRPPWRDDSTRPLTLKQFESLPPFFSRSLVINRSWRIEISFTFESESCGILLAHGDQAGGYCIFIEDGRLQLVVNTSAEELQLDCGDVEPGECKVCLDGMARNGGLWDAAVSVDETERTCLEALPAWAGLVPFEGIDVGMDRRSPVSWKLYTRYGSFAYSGKIESVLILPGPFTEDETQLRTRVNDAADQAFD